MKHLLFPTALALVLGAVPSPLPAQVTFVGTIDFTRADPVLPITKAPVDTNSSFYVATLPDTQWLFTSSTSGIAVSLPAYV